MKTFRLVLTLLLSTCSLPAFAALAELNRLEGTIGTDEYQARDVTLAPDFKMELIYVVPTDYGSWLPVTWDDQGRMLAGSHSTEQFFRLTIPSVGSDDPVVVEPFELGIGHAHGLQYAFGSLYLSVGDEISGGRKASGIYRISDTNGDDKYDQVRVLRNINGGGQHGTHAVRLAPDGQSLFMLNGNAVASTIYDNYAAPPIWGEDVLVERFGGNPSLAPQGWIGQFNPAGDSWRMYAVGMRNPVDFAFNKDGELFEYDADMEFDKGLSYYRPTHVGHVISGADFGFRSPSGSFKWPQYYIDDWGPVVNIGSGSPTGVTFGTGTRFPARYQDAMYISDWSYGNIYAVFMHPQGSSYTGTPEVFASGRPFGAGGLTVNPNDGSFYIIIGGNTQSALYRVTYTGDESINPTAPDARYAGARAQRRALEAYHGVSDPTSIDVIWPQLDSDDRGIRYAARTALEFQDQARWRDRALSETNPRIAIAAIVALARLNGVEENHRTAETPPADRALQARMLTALDRIAWDGLAYQDKLDLLRAYSLTFIRMGAPGAETARRLAARLDSHFPANNRELNWQLAEMMIYLQAPSAAGKTMALMRSAPSLPYFPMPDQYINPLLLARGNPGGAAAGAKENVTLLKQQDQSFYAEMLRTLQVGWTPELREEYFQWFLDAPGLYQGGSNFGSALTTIRQQAVGNLTEAERAALEPILSQFPAAAGGRGGGGF